MLAEYVRSGFSVSDAVDTMISIRLLEPADAAAFSALRLVAIDTSPSAIWPTRAEEAGRSIREVEARLRASGTQAVFGALTDDGGLIGIAGVRREALVQLAHKACFGVCSLRLRIAATGSRGA